MRSFARVAMALLFACSALPVFAAPADLVTVEAAVAFPQASQGTGNDGQCFISNNTNGDVRVRLDVRVIYSDGEVQRMRGIPDPGVLGPGDAFFQSVFFVIPPDAALGTATFVCDVSAQQQNLRERETATATFEVVP